MYIKTFGNFKFKKIKLVSANSLFENQKSIQPHIIFKNI